MPTLGPPQGWLRAVMDGDTEMLEMGGDCHLARAAIDALNTELFRILQRRP